MNHTPGPWKKIGNDIIDIESANGVHICRIFSVRGHNADLIAAAPEMLEALKDLLEVWGNQGDGNDYGEIVKFAIRTVRKAEGKTA